MNVEAIAGLAHDEVGPIATQAATGVPGAGFSQLVQQGLEAVNGRLHESEAGLQALAVGQADSLHEVVVRMEEARISFQLMLQVRNRLLEAYQEVMRMQL